MMETGSAPAPLRLLLIDDEKGFVGTLAKRLVKRNIEVTTAFSGKEGIQKLRKTDFDVVVLDLKMEDMGGLEVLRILKIMVPDLPVVMLSGHASDQSVREGIEAGASDYLTKPCDFSELVEKIYEVTKKSA